MEVGQVPVETERTKLMCGHTRRAMPSKPASNYTNQKDRPRQAPEHELCVVPSVACRVVSCACACTSRVSMRARLTSGPAM